MEGLVSCPAWLRLYMVVADQASSQLQPVLLLGECLSTAVAMLSLCLNPLPSCWPSSVPMRTYFPTHQPIPPLCSLLTPAGAEPPSKFQRLYQSPPRPQLLPPLLAGAAVMTPAQEAQWQRALTSPESLTEHLKVCA